MHAHIHLPCVNCGSSSTVTLANINWEIKGRGKIILKGTVQQFETYAAYFSGVRLEDLSKICPK